MCREDQKDTWEEEKEGDNKRNGCYTQILSEEGKPDDNKRGNKNRNVEPLPSLVYGTNERKEGEAF